MNNHTTVPATMLSDVLLLKEKMRSLGWSFCYNVEAENEGIAYFLIKSDTSGRRRRNDIFLTFGNIELAKGFAILLEAGRIEKVISGSIEHAPTFNTYLEISRRLSAHDCHLRGVMDFDRMAIGYSISIIDQSLIFNEWEAVDEFAQFLDSGAPRKAALRRETERPLVMEGTPT